MLSQAEIDALLSGQINAENPEKEEGVNLAKLISSPAETPLPAEDDVRQIRPYNFWSPDRFSKEQMRAVELIHEDLAERLTASLPSFLRLSLRMRVVHTEQGRFHEFLRDVETGTLFHLVVLSPLPGQMIITISPDVSAIILEQRLGGRGEQIHRGRKLTEIDQILLRNFAEHMLTDIKAVWSKVVAIEPHLEDSTTNHHWVQMTMGSERVMLISFEIPLQNATGTMNVYIPFPLLKPIANVLNPHVWITGHKDNQPSAETRQAALEGISTITLPLSVILGRANLTIRELSQLQSGDVILLDTHPQQDLTVQLAHNPRFTARVGKQGERMVAQITNILHPAEKITLQA